MRENILYAMNQMLSYTWIVALIGILIALFLERKIVIDVFQKKSSKQPWYKSLSPLWIRLSYSVAGLALVLLSFTTSSGTNSSTMSAARVPERGEKMNV